MVEWVKYPELETVHRLRNEGRELIGKVVYVTEKRDGENVSLWLDGAEVKISSHNQQNAGEDIVSRMTKVLEYPRVCNLLDSEFGYHKHLIAYGELLKTVSPTRIEPRRKHIHWVMFDLYDIDEKKFLPYEYVYQLGYHFKIPVVKCLDKVFINSLEDNLSQYIVSYLKWCKKHKREGIVGKCYDNQTFFKEKIDAPKLPRISRTDLNQKPNLPTMDTHTIQRGLQHAYEEVTKNGFDWKDKSKAMPIVVKHAQLEAAEHNFSMPKNIYQFYLGFKEES